MSNHEIGHVMDIAIKGILDLYDEGAFSAATARKLIKTNLRLVAGYDGNDGLYALRQLFEKICPG